MNARRRSWRTRAIFAAGCIATLSIAPSYRAASKSPAPAPKTRPASVVAKSAPQDDSFVSRPPKDLELRPEGVRKAAALTNFVEGIALEEAGELEKALEAYRKVLNVDPGHVTLASRVAGLLTRREDFPGAIDVLKDAVKASPNASEPYLQLAFIYARYLNKKEQAIDYVNKAIVLNPRNIAAYQRLYEIELAGGEEAKARLALDRAAKVQGGDAAFWLRLGKLYASSVFKPDAQPPPDEVARVNEFFKRASEQAKENLGMLKEIADYYASSQQIQEAIPLYLKVLELEPEDANAREKLATGFVLTNQPEKAIAMLEQIIQTNPEKFQPYELLGQLLDEDARGLSRANQHERADKTFEKAAANYEQSLLIHPSNPRTYLRLAQLLIGPLKKSEKAVTVLSEARMRFRGIPEMGYYLALALREAKQPQKAITLFEETLNEATEAAAEMLTGRFYFDYATAAEQAGLYEKAADLFRKSIAVDPEEAAEAYNSLAYMWAEQNTRLEEAEDAVKRALQMEPNNGAYIDTLGWVEYRQGKYEQALQDLLRAAQNLTREDAVIYEHIGDTYLKLNRVPQALEAWQKAVALDPKNSKVAAKIESTKTQMSKGESLKANPIQ